MTPVRGRSRSWLSRFLGSFEGDRPARGEPERVAEAQAVIDELDPFVRADGGRLVLVSVDRGWVEVRLEGACRTCSVQDETLFGALEPKLRDACPWFEGLRAAQS